MRSIEMQNSFITVYLFTEMFHEKGLRNFIGTWGGCLYAMRNKVGDTTMEYRSCHRPLVRNNLGSLEGLYEMYVTL